MALPRPLRPFTRAGLALAVGSASAAPDAVNAANALQTPRGTIPLCPGLTIVTAIARPEGDYESIKTITTAGPTEIGVAYSAQVPKGPGVMRKFKVRRTILRSDLANATLYAHLFHTRGAVTIPGSTGLGTSRAVLQALKTAGAAELGIIASDGYSAIANPAAQVNLHDYAVTYRLARIGGGPVTLNVTVNDAVVPLLAIRARGDYIGDKAEFHFLDDEDNPVALRYRFDTGGEAADAADLDLQVVKISYRCTTPAQPPGSDRVSRLERALREDRRAVVYDLYFDFNSDAIRQESDSTLRDIAEVMRRNPDWKLSIEGHTDAVASDRYNVELSGRRAAAVKTALTGQYDIAGDRLATAGYGESRPQDRNDTLEGRARNRRVELVRQ